jgi:stage V sporulation protein SpoVS
MIDVNSIEEYQEHSTTIKVSGSTQPKAAGRCAFHYMQKGLFPIEFLCIGANANQQATKAMGVFSFMVARSIEFGGAQVAFQPMLRKTSTVDAISNQSRPRIVTVWRTVVFEPKTFQAEGTSES